MPNWSNATGLLHKLFFSIQIHVKRKHDLHLRLWSLSIGNQVKAFSADFCGFVLKVSLYEANVKSPKKRKMLVAFYMRQLCVWGLHRWKCIHCSAFFDEYFTLCCYMWLCRLPFCICMLSNRYRKYKSVELGDQLRLAGLHIWSSIPGGNLLVALLSFSL